MRTELYWVDPHLAVMPRPRGGDWLTDEIAAWAKAGLNVVVSLLEEDEVAELELADEAAHCQATGMTFLSFPIADRGVPSSAEECRKVIAELVHHRREGRKIGVHCRQGIGRASLVAACVLTQEGISPADGFALIASCRGRTVPDTPEQVRWLEGWVGAK
jgi:protein-tyrosine phosphatase